VRRLLQREGAWELIPRPANLPDTQAALARVPPADLRQDNSGCRSIGIVSTSTFRSGKQAAVQLGQLEQRWATPRMRPAGMVSSPDPHRVRPARR